MSKILYLVTEDWFFASHFLPFVKAAQGCGLETVVAARVDRHRDVLEAAGCRVVALPIQRRGLGPAGILRETFEIVRLIRRERPDIVHCIALRMVVLGGLASRLARVRRLVLAVTGLGTLWVEGDPKSARTVTRSAISGTVARWLLRWTIARLLAPRGQMLFENSDDPRDLGLDGAAANVTIVPGAGVDPADFAPTPEPAAPPVRLAVVARMLRTKGVPDAVAATLLARADGANVELHLFGSPDPANRHSCTEAELTAWSAQPGICWHGPTKDVAQVWRDHHVAVLLTYYREGLPRTLVEAAAAGRPMIASDVAGCREIVRDGEDGFLVPPRDPNAAALAIAQLARDQALRQRMGAAAHARFRDGFTEAVVRGKIAALYAGLLR